MSLVLLCILLVYCETAIEDTCRNGEGPPDQRHWHICCLPLSPRRKRPRPASPRIEPRLHRPIRIAAYNFVSHHMTTQIWAKNVSHSSSFEADLLCLPPRLTEMRAIRKLEMNDQRIRSPRSSGHRRRCTPVHFRRQGSV